MDGGGRTSGAGVGPEPRPEIIVKCDNEKAMGRIEFPIDT